MVTERQNYSCNIIHWEPRLHSHDNTCFLRMLEREHHYNWIYKNGNLADRREGDKNHCCRFRQYSYLRDQESPELFYILCMLYDTDLPGVVPTKSGITAGYEACQKCEMPIILIIFCTSLFQWERQLVIWIFTRVFWVVSDRCRLVENINLKLNFFFKVKWNSFSGNFEIWSDRIEWQRTEPRSFWLPLNLRSTKFI